AEALGATYKNRKVGTFGTIGIVSFNGNKLITTSGGGALVTDNESYAKTAKYLSTQARGDFKYYHHEHIGYNYRMSNICAAIGRGQMEAIQERIMRRREIFNHYLNAFESVASYPREENGAYANRWLSVFDFHLNSQWRDEVIQLLEDQNIESRPVWKPMHLQPIFNGARYWGDNKSEAYFNKGLCLPSRDKLNKKEQDKVIEIIYSKLP
ncbi:MAG: DegT/DnrJ/EryC1/StrS family aminotransferase, partial [Fulvivirga sp.]|nr:DegT/DnrJ/EryC1/StrS family aminotransferase [Fulvivirga sp.]